MNSKYLVSIALTLAALGFSGCAEEVFDRKPKVVITQENFFQTEEHAVLATNAVYNMLRSWEVHVFSYIGLTDIASDDADKGSFPADAFFLQELDDFTHTPSNLAPQTVWGGYYTGIYRANLALDNIPDIEMDANLKTRLMGECKFLRAYFYFNLVRWFGDIPLITRTLGADEFLQERRPVAEVYAQIEQDLLDAIAGLPAKYASADLGRATKGAAQALLAKVYLTEKDYVNTEKYALDVINSGLYALYPDYGKLFQPIGENSSESIFEVQAAAFEAGGGGSQYNEVQGVRGMPNLGWGFNRPSDNLVAAYEPGDPRRDATILYVGEILPDGSDVVHDNPDIIGERYNQKAWVPQHPGGNGNGNGNIRLIRYADVLLMAAEALNENDKPAQALVYLNMVRARARKNNPNILPDVTVTNKDQLRTRIWNERRVELALEQQRWFDLCRQGRVAQVMQAVGKNFVTNKNELWPIPQKDIDLSQGTLTQNPGY